MENGLGLLGMMSVCAALSGCGGGGTCAIASGTAIAVARTNGTGTCSAGVVAGVTSLNGHETFTTMKAASCNGGAANFTLTIDFFTQDAADQSCSATDKVVFADLLADGGTGTDSLSVTCADGTTCTEMFDVAFSPD